MFAIRNSLRVALQRCTRTSQTLTQLKPCHISLSSHRRSFITATQPRQFASQDDSPVELPDQPLTSSPARSWPRMSSAFRIENLPLEATKEDVENLFSPHGAIRDLIISPPIEGSESKLAMVLFNDHHVADQIIRAHRGNPFYLHDRELHLRYGSLSKMGQVSDTLFIHGIQPDTTEDDIRNLVGHIAEVQGIRMNVEFCHVEFSSPDDAHMAFTESQLNPMRNSDGSLLRVTFATRTSKAFNTLCLTGWDGELSDLENLLKELGCDDTVTRLSKLSPKFSTKQRSLVFVECLDYESAKKVRAGLENALPTLLVEWANQKHPNQKRAYEKPPYLKYHKKKRFDQRRYNQKHGEQKDSNRRR